VELDDKEPSMKILLAGATGAIGRQLVPRLLAGEAAAVLMTEARGASNAKAKRELGWQTQASELASGLRRGSGMTEALRADRADRVARTLLARVLEIAEGRFTASARW
jgi:nucleoside-diphosphate-sugar epimerase